MPTPHELFLAVVIPVAVSALLAAIAALQRWTWLMPLALGAGFMVGHACFRLPHLPPHDGSDWMFWLAAPFMLLGVVDAVFNLRWGWVLAVLAGVIPVIVLYPLVPQSVSAEVRWACAPVIGVAAMVLAWVTWIVQTRIGWVWTLLAFCIALGGAAAVSFSSGMRIGGLYAAAAAGALGPVAVLGARLGNAKSVVLLAAPLLAGLLLIGHFYADPGMSIRNFGVLLAAPVLMLTGALLPVKQQWIRGAVALLVVVIAVAAVAAPTAAKAKKAAETDPYENVYK